MTKRWLTDPAASGPTEIRPVWTPVENDTFVKILAFAGDPANQFVELMHCLNAAGVQVHDTSTGCKGAPRTPAMDAAIVAGGGVRLWHNHPSQDSLSHTDWLSAGISDDIEILALNERGSIFVGRIVDWEDRLRGLLEWLPRLGGDLEFHMDSLARTREVDPDLRVALGSLTGHVLNRALASRMLVRYGYRFINGDDAAVARLEEHGILSDGEAYAANGIDEYLDRLAVAGGPEKDGSWSEA